MPSWQVWPQAKHWLGLGRANTAFGTLSCPCLSIHSPRLHPPNHLGTPKPPNSGGLTLTNAARIAKPMPEAHRVLKCLCAPSQRHHRVIPSRVAGGPSWDRNAQDQDPQVAPPIPSVMETQQGSPSQGLPPKRYPYKGRHHPPSPAIPCHHYASHSPTSAGTSSPRQAPGLGGNPSRPPPAPPGCPGGGSRVQKQFPHAKELGPSRHALLKPHQPSY